MSNRTVVVTISDRCSSGSAADRSGPAIIEMLPDVEGALVHREVIPDEVDRIAGLAREWIGRCDLLITTGGTGVAARDVTPDALQPLVERSLPGFGETIRMKGFERTPMSILSRSGAGIAGNTMMVWLPGSPKAVRECMEWLAPAIRHGCQLLRGESPH